MPLAPISNEIVVTVAILLYYVIKVKRNGVRNEKDDKNR